MDARLLTRIDPQDIRLGSPTRVDIFDSGGNLFLARGATVYRADTVERLQDEGYKVANAKTSTGRPQEAVFLRIGDIADKLVEFELALSTEGSITSFVHKYRSLAQAILQCCDEDADAALAQSYLDYHHPYSVLHHILVAVVVSVLSKVRGWNDADRNSLVAAALTHDIGAIAMRSELGGAASLDEAQRAFVREHPEAGVQQLEKLGVSDALWLEAVQQHHEHIDGSGYPIGTRSKLHSAASLMTVADSFAAMMRPRPYRERLLGKAILDDLRQHAGTRYDPAQVEAIATYIGNYHAGSIVRLLNGDMAVVTRHNPDKPETPDLLLIATSGDQPMEKPYAIDSTDPECAIVSALHPEVSLRFRTMVNKSWRG
jgi:HD-GYP domain-containing protein (c-di-GMP phosphodiesterase class II)